MVLLYMVTFTMLYMVTNRLITNWTNKPAVSPRWLGSLPVASPWPARRFGHPPRRVKTGGNGSPQPQRRERWGRSFSNVAGWNPPSSWKLRAGKSWKNHLYTGDFPAMFGEGNVHPLTASQRLTLSRALCRTPTFPEYTWIYPSNAQALIMIVHQCSSSFDSTNFSGTQRCSKWGAFVGKPTYLELQPTKVGVFNPAELYLDSAPGEPTYPIATDKWLNCYKCGCHSINGVISLIYNWYFGP